MWFSTAVQRELLSVMYIILMTLLLGKWQWVFLLGLTPVPAGLSQFHIHTESSSVGTGGHKPTPTFPMANIEDTYQKV